MIEFLRTYHHAVTLRTCRCGGRCVRRLYPNNSQYNQERKAIVIKHSENARDVRSVFPVRKVARAETQRAEIMLRAAWAPRRDHQDDDGRIEEIISRTARGEAGERCAPEHARHGGAIGCVFLPAAAPHGDVQTLDSPARLS